MDIEDIKEEELIIDDLNIISRDVEEKEATKDSQSAVLFICKKERSITHDYFKKEIQRRD